MGESSQGAGMAKGSEVNESSGTMSRSVANRQPTAASRAAFQKQAMEKTNCRLLRGAQACFIKSQRPCHPSTTGQAPCLPLRTSNLAYRYVPEAARGRLGRRRPKSRSRIRVRAQAGVTAGDLAAWGADAQSPCTRVSSHGLVRRTRHRGTWPRAVRDHPPPLARPVSGTGSPVCAYSSLASYFCVWRCRGAADTEYKYLCWLAACACSLGP